MKNNFKWKIATSVLAVIVLLFCAAAVRSFLVYDAQAREAEDDIYSALASEITPDTKAVALGENATLFVTDMLNISEHTVKSAYEVYRNKFVPRVTELADQADRKIFIYRISGPSNNCVFEGVLDYSSGSPNVHLAVGTEYSDIVNSVILSAGA